MSVRAGHSFRVLLGLPETAAPLARELRSNHVFDVVGRADAGRDVLDCAAIVRPEVVVLDTATCSDGVADVVAALHALDPDVAVVVVGGAEETAFAGGLPPGVVACVDRAGMTGDLLATVLVLASLAAGTQPSGRDIVAAVARTARARRVAFGRRRGRSLRGRVVLGLWRLWAWAERRPR